MSFLSPELLALLIPLLGLPLVLHLLNRGFPGLIRFPSIELIRETCARRSRLHRWRHWLLLLLRTLVLLLVLLAFLQPVLKQWGANPADRSGRQVLLIVDHSVTMEARGDGPSSRERAAQEAAKLIASLGAEDTVNILLADPELATCFVAFSSDFAEAKRFLHQLAPGYSHADINLANAAAARLLGPTAARPEIYYLSDFTRKKWANANFKLLPPAAKLFFVDVGPSRRGNRAILDVRPGQTTMLAGDSVPLEISLANFSDAPFTGQVRVTLDQQPPVTQDVSLAAWSEEKVTVPVTVGGPGIHRCEVRLPPDALEADDQFLLTLSVLTKEEVLIVSDGAEERRSGAYFLKTALNPFENEAGSLLPRVIPARDLTAARLAGVQKVLLTQVGRLPPEACDALARTVFRGGGLIYFLDGPADPENLAALEKLTGQHTLPLRLARRQMATNVTADAQQFVRGDFQSPYLKLFQGNARQDLALMEFYDYYQAGATGAGGVLLEYGDGSPAMAVLHHGLGAVLLLNFSAGELSSNLQRQRIFPAWIQDLMKAISTQEPSPSAYTVGQTVQTEIWRAEMRMDLVGPAGVLANTKRELRGQRCALEFKPERPGFYTLGSPRPAYAFGVNAATDQADLRPLDKSLLPTEFADHHDAHVILGAEDYDTLAHGRPIYHWLLWAALAVLMAETAFQLWLRRQPA